MNTTIGYSESTTLGKRSRVGSVVGGYDIGEGGSAEERRPVNPALSENPESCQDRFLGSRSEVAGTDRLQHLELRLAFLQFSH